MIEELTAYRDIVLYSHYFSPDFYKNEYKLHSLSDEDCALHYCKEGWKEGFIPSKYFDLSRFCKFKELPEVTENPLVKFVKNKCLDGYEIPSESEVKLLEYLELSKVFDSTFYSQSNPDVLSAGIDPALHFVRNGWLEERPPCKGVVVSDTLRNIAELTFESVINKLKSAVLKQNQLKEVILQLKKEKLFSVEYYLDTYPDIKESKVDPYEHFVCYGVHEKRLPNDSLSLKDEIRKDNYLSLDNVITLLQKHKKIDERKSASIPEPSNEICDCRQIDVLIVVKNYELASAIWRAKFLSETLRIHGFKCVIRSENEAMKHIEDSSIVFLQKFTSVDAYFNEIVKRAKIHKCKIWGDMDDLFHPDYIQHSGQALAGLWDESQQAKIAQGFIHVISNYDTLLVSTPKLKNVFEKEFPEKQILVKRNRIPHRFLSRQNIPKVITQSIKIIYPSGSLSHKKDFEPIAEVLFEFLRRFKDCTLTLLGGDSVQVPKKLLERKNVRLMPRMGFEEMMLEIERHDLMLVPLLLNDFNHAKSNIKFIEGAAVKVPVLTTSSSEFESFVTDKDNGFIEDNFDNWLERLLDFRRNPNLLAKAGDAAYKTILKSLSADILEQEITETIRVEILENIDKRYPSKSHQKFPNWLLEENKYIPLVGREGLIKRVNDYIEHRATRGKARYVIYTCLSDNYDSLKVPEYLDNNIDYICFSDRPVYGYGIWQVRSYNQDIQDPTRISRHPKILPHHYLGDYEASIYIDANILPVESMSHFFNRLAQSGCHLAGVKHPWRNCIYEEAKACMRSEKDKVEIIESTIEYLKKSGFPEGYGLFENNFIYRKHNEVDVVQAMELWWQTYSNYSKRDQLSYMFALQQSNITPEVIFLEKGKNVRNVAEFLYFSHGDEDSWKFPLISS